MGTNTNKSGNKGKQGEREVCRILQPVVTQVYEAHGLEPPKLMRNTLQSADGGCDIVARTKDGSLAHMDWMSLEVKYHAALAVETWWAQTLRQAGSTRLPVLFYRRNNAVWKVRMLGLLGTPGAGITVPVTVSVEHFCSWLRIKLSQELSQQ
jgi:hypothetical protein